MIVLIDPRGAAHPASQALAARPGAAAARRIGFLCNEPAHLSGPHFQPYTAALETAFRRRLGVERFDREVKPVLSRPADEAQLDRLAGCDGVVNGLAK
jgi:hypothetical protein